MTRLRWTSFLCVDSSRDGRNRHTLLAIDEKSKMLLKLNQALQVFFPQGDWDNDGACVANQAGGHATDGRVENNGQQDNLWCSELCFQEADSI